jgi:hypothetical protein
MNPTSACSDHGSHRILPSYWLAQCFLMKKSTKVQLYFGLDCGMMEFFTYAIQRTIDNFPAFLENGLKLFQIFRTKIKKIKTYSGLSNGTTLMQIQSGRPVPLIILSKFPTSYISISPIFLHCPPTPVTENFPRLKALSLY